MSTIQKQIEFYFSDSNFRKDTFLREAALSDSEGFVPISTLLTFNKLKKLTTNIEEIVHSIESSNIVEASADGLKIRRKYPLPAVDNSKECTLYVKGFPLEDSDVTIEAITEQFSTYGNVCMVKLRKDIHKKFKGSCFIEFDQPSAVDAAVAAANQNGTVTLSFKETPYLCVMKLGEWLERKAAKSGKGEKKNNNNNNNSNNNNNDDTTTGSGKRKRDESKSEGDDNEGKEVDDNNDNEDDETKPSNSGGVVSFTPGLILKVSGIPSTVTVYQIKDVFKPFGEVKYVEYNTGDTTAYVRLGDSDSANSVSAALKDGQITLSNEGGDESKLEGEVITGDEELTYWTKIGQGSSNKSSSGKGRGGGRGRGRGGRGGGRGGRGNKKSRR